MPISPDTLRQTTVDIFDRYNATRHSRTTLADVADIIARGTRISRPQLTGKHPDEDHRDLTMQQIQHLHRERTRNGYHTPEPLTRVKERMPLIGIAARFDDGGRTTAHIRTLTQLAQADIDDHDGTALAALGTTAKELRDRAASDPHTAMAYVTVSQGLRLIFPYDMPEGLTPKEQTAHYAKVCAAANSHYARILGLPDSLFDNAVAKPVQLSALAFDPGVFLTSRPALPFTASEAQTAWNARQTAGSTKARNRQKTGCAAAKRLDKLYNNTVAPALADQGSTFTPNNRNNHLRDTACWLNRRGEPCAAVAAWATQRFAQDDFTDDEIRKTIEGVYTRYADEHATEKPGKDKTPQWATVDDIKTFLAAHARFRHNDITARTEMAGNDNSDWHPFTDRDLNTLWTQMSQHQRTNINDIDHIIRSDYAPRFNPLTDYLNQLEHSARATADIFTDDDGSPCVTLDGRDPIAELAATVTVKGGTDAQRLWLHCLRLWLTGMVAAWLHEDTVNEIIPVLIGRQGSYKTTWFQHIMPPQLQPYYHTKVDAARLTKDDKLALAEFGLICCEELDTMSPAELNQLKAAVSMRHIEERAAYARFKERRPHVASFCGTGNNLQFLTDHTGNRRWMPFEVERIQPPQQTCHHHDLVFLQALLLHRNGFRHWLDADTMLLQEQHNRRFETPPLEAELADLYFRKPTETETGEFITATRALQIMGTSITQKLTPAHVGRAFTELGFKRAKSKGRYGYIVIPRTPEEIRLYGTTMAQQSEQD